MRIVILKPGIRFANMRLLQVLKNISFLTLIFFLSSFDCISQPHIQIGIKEGLPSMTVYDVLQDEEGYIWVATESGVCRYNGINFDRLFDYDLPLKPAVRLYEDEQRRVWIFYFSGEVACWKEGKMEVFRTLSLCDLFLEIATHKYIWSNAGMCGFILHDSIANLPSKITSKTLDDYRCFVSRATIPIQKPFDKASKATPKQLSIKNDSCSYRVINSATYVQGKHKTYYSDFHEKRVWVSKNKQLEEVIAVPSEVISLYLDKQENLFICSFDGLYRKSEKGLEKSFSGYTISSMCIDKNGGKWYAAHSKGLLYIPPSNGVYTLAHSLGKNCETVFAGKDSLLFSYDQNVSIQYGKKVQSITMPSSLKDIILSKQGLILLGTNELYKLQEFQIEQKVLERTNNYKTIEQFTSSGDFLLGNKYRIILSNSSFSNFSFLLRDRNFTVFSTRILSDTSFLIGSSNGLIYSNRDQLFRYIKGFSFQIYKLSPAKNGGTWVSAEKGIYLIDDQFKIKYFIGKEQGFPTAPCKSLIEVEEGVLYAGTSVGLYKINLYPSIRVIPFSQENLRTEINDLSASGDSMWVASWNGISVFNYKTFEPAAYLYKPSLQLFFQNQFYQSGDKINIPHTGIPLQVLANYPMLDGKGELLYRYDAGNWQTLPSGNLSLLPDKPGEHSVEVKFCRGYGSCSESTKLDFYIQPKIWQRTLFWVILSLLGFFAVGFLTWMYFQSKLRKEQIRLLQEQENGRLRAIALQAQMNPHFLFNALSTLHDMILSKQLSEATQYVGKFAQLLREMLMLSFQSAVSLDREIAFLQMYAQLEIMGQPNKVEIEITLDDELVGDEKIPPMIIQPFVENSFKHGLKNKENGAILRIIFQLQNDYIRCEIEDNGIGRVSSSNNKKEGHTSSAIRITEDRLSVFPNLPTPVIQIIDLYEQDLALGTKVILHLPILK